MLLRRVATGVKALAGDSLLRLERRRATHEWARRMRPANVTDRETHVILGSIMSLSLWS